MTPLSDTPPEVERRRAEAGRQTPAGRKGRLVAALALAAPVPPPRPDALPDGATARLGTLAFRGWSLDGLSFSPDGKTLRAARDWRRLGWDAATGRPLPVRDFAPEGGGGLTGNTVFAGDRTVWVGSKGLVRPDHVGDNTVVVTDRAGGEVSRFRFRGLTFPGYLETFDPAWMPKAVVTPDGKYLSVWVRGDKALRTYDLDTGKPLFAREVEAKSDPGLHASPDGKTLYLHEYEGPVRRFDLRTGEPLPDLAVPPARSYRIEAGPDGRRAVFRDHPVGSDADGQLRSAPGDCTLTVWDLAANAAAGKLQLGGVAHHFKFAGPGTLLVLAVNHRPGRPPAHAVSRWDVATRAREWEVPVPAADWLAVSPDGARFAVTGRCQAGYVYDAATGARQGPETGHDGPVAWVGFSPDGGTITTAGPDAVRTWNRRGEGKAAAAGPGFGGPPPLAALGDRLVWAVPAADGATAELVGWDPERAAVGWRMRLAGRAPDRVFSPDGRRAVGLTWGETAKRWDVAVYDGPAGKTLHAWTMKDIPVWGWPWPVAFTGDGAVVFVGCEDGVIGLDVATGREVARVPTGAVGGDHLSRRFPLAASADGRRIAVVTGHDAVGGKLRVRVFDVKSGGETAGHDLTVSPEQNGGVWYGVGLTFSPNGRKLAVTAGPGTEVVVCDAAGGRPRVFDGGLSRPTALAFGPDNATLAVGYDDGTALVWDLAPR